MRETLVDSLHRVLQRGERLDTLGAKTDDLAADAALFNATGRSLRRTMAWQYWKVRLLIGAVVLIGVVVIFLLGCFAGGRDCTKGG